MKFAAAAFLVLASQFVYVFAGIAPGAAEECGDLGVMSYTASTLEDGVNPAAIRKCKEHPLSANGIVSPALAARKCWYGDDYGCTKGYCWEKCGKDGSWCWIAWNKGNGEWRTCSGKEDCKKVDTAECGKGDCKDCGCNCH